MIQKLEKMFEKHRKRKEATRIIWESEAKKNGEGHANQLGKSRLFSPYEALDKLLANPEIAREDSLTLAQLARMEIDMASFRLGNSCYRRSELTPTEITTEEKRYATYQLAMPMMDSLEKSRKLSFSSNEDRGQAIENYGIKLFSLYQQFKIGTEK